MPPPPLRRVATLLVLMSMIAAGIGLGGCDSYSAPRLTFAEVQPTQRSDEGAAMIFTINAENDNDVALPLRTVSYTVELGGKKVFEGTRSAESTLRRRGVQQFSLPAVLNLTDAENAGLAAGPTRFRLSGELVYQTPGQFAEVLFDAGLRTPTQEFEFEGDVDLSRVSSTLVPAATPASTTPPPASPTPK